VFIALLADTTLFLTSRPEVVRAMGDVLMVQVHVQSDSQDFFGRSLLSLVLLQAILAGDTLPPCW
jgi:hypothetical protein